jgi:hypothetical protein
MYIFIFIFKLILQDGLLGVGLLSQRVCAFKILNHISDCFLEGSNGLMFSAIECTASSLCLAVVIAILYTISCSLFPLMSPLSSVNLPFYSELWIHPNFLIA